MAVKEQLRSRTKNEPLNVGELIDTQTRSLQNVGRKSSDCLSVNLTSVGIRVHGLSSDDHARIHIFTEGIWIERVETGGSESDE